MNSTEILCANKWLFEALIQKLKPAHKRKSAIKPARNARPAFCGIANATKKLVMAISHQGKKRQAVKLRGYLELGVM